MSKKKAFGFFLLAALLIGGAAFVWYGFKKPGSLYDHDLIVAAKTADYEAAKQAIAAGADVNFREGNSLLGGRREDYESGYTALHYAAERGYTHIVQLLVENGANIDAENGLGNTPLLLAINFTMKDTVVYLLEHGANVHHKNKNGAGAIAHAEKKMASPATNEILEIVRKAIDKKK